MCLLTTPGTRVNSRTLCTEKRSRNNLNARSEGGRVSSGCSYSSKKLWLVRFGHHGLDQITELFRAERISFKVGCKRSLAINHYGVERVHK